MLDDLAQLLVDNLEVSLVMHLQLEGDVPHDRGLVLALVQVWLLQHLRDLALSHVALLERDLGQTEAPQMHDV